MDLRKAFDSVSTYSIRGALRRFLIEPHILRGVKRGDRLSPVLFNLVMDEPLEDVHALLPGISVDGLDVAALAYRPLQ